MRRLALALALIALPALAGCAPTLSQPFASLGTATVTIYRLQNVEPTAARRRRGRHVPNPERGSTAHLRRGRSPPPGAHPAGADPRHPRRRAANGAGPPASTASGSFSWQDDQRPREEDDEILDILGHGSNFGPLQRRACTPSSASRSSPRPARRPTTSSSLCRAGRSRRSTSVAVRHHGHHARRREADRRRSDRRRSAPPVATPSGT